MFNIVIVLIFLVVLFVLILLAIIVGLDDEEDSILAKLFSDGGWWTPEIANSKTSLRRVKVNWDWNDALHPRVGHFYSFHVTYFSYDQTGVAEAAGQPRDPITVEINHITEEHIQSSIHTTTKRKIEFTMDPLENQARNYRKFRIKFFSGQSGNYEINIKLDNDHIQGSPFQKRFVSGTPDPEQCIFNRVTQVKVFVVGGQHKLTMTAMDRYGNACRGRDINLDLIEFTVHHLDVNDPTRKCGTFVYNTRLDPESFGTVVLLAEVHRPGILRGNITYAGSPIKNGSFDIVVLNYLEAQKVEYYWALQNTFKNYFFRAEFFQEVSSQAILEAVRDGNANTVGIASANSSTTTGRGTASNPGSSNSRSQNQTTNKLRVEAMLTSKNLNVYKRFWGLFGRRIASLRVTVHDRFKILHVDPETDRVTFEFSDDQSPTVIMSMAATSLRCFIAVFTKYLARKLGEKEFFPERVKYFYNVLIHTKQLDHRTFNDDIPLSINRNDVIESTRLATQKLKPRDWCKTFRIEFIDEPAIDGGGLRREFFEILCTALFQDNPNGLFCSMGNSDLVHPHPYRNPRWPGKTHERIWEMAGRVVGKCLLEGACGGSHKLAVKARFSRSFLAMMLGLKPHYKYFEQDDPELFIGKIKHILENEARLLNIPFTEEVYNRQGTLTKVVELIPKGGSIFVDDSNKERYLMALAQYRFFTRVKPEVEFFLRGLNSLVPEDLLSIFDVNELELLMCGKSTYSMEDLKKYHSVILTSCDLETGVRLVDWFFTSVMAMNTESKARLLQFTTGCSTLPAGGLRRLSPMFTIQPMDKSGLGKFPTAHTCGNLLVLYDHATFDSFDKALNLAITEGCEGFSMV